MNDFIAWLEAHQETLIASGSILASAIGGLIGLIAYGRKKRKETEAKLEAQDKELAALKLAMWKRTFIKCPKCGEDIFLADCDIDIKEPLMEEIQK